MESKRVIRTQNKPSEKYLMGETSKNKEQQQRKEANMRRRNIEILETKLKSVARKDIRKSFEKKVKVNCVK